jgi:hypothetical protein
MNDDEVFTEGGSGLRSFPRYGGTWLQSSPELFRGTNAQGRECTFPNLSNGESIARHFVRAVSDYRSKCGCHPIVSIIHGVRQVHVFPVLFQPCGLVFFG